MNILLCSAGRRVKLVQYFKKELGRIGGRIVATDCDATAPALHHANIAEVVPPIDHPNYIQKIKELCREHQIKAVISLIDPELSILSEYKDDFACENIKVIVSDKEVVDICYDKYLTYKFLQNNNIPGVPVYLTFNEVLDEVENNRLNYPLIVKPRTGSASVGICKVNSINGLENLMKQNPDLIVQPFVTGIEFGVDVYIDLITHTPTHIFTKRKIKMRAGETDKSKAIKDQQLNNLIQDLISALKPIGPIDVDCFKTESGFVVSEINPRFGGGYLHAHESGLNFVRCIINNLQGISNVECIGDYKEGSIMIKFDNVMLINS